ncbi:MAG: RidA family protein [bacterium]
MIRRRVSSASPYEDIIGFSRAVRVGNSIAVSGTGPIAPDGATAGVGDAAAQTRRCLEIIQAAIEEAGGFLTDVSRTRIYLTDISLWEEVGRVHGEFFRNIKPAATMIEVTSLVRPEWLVEIEADAIVSD